MFGLLGARAGIGATDETPPNPFPFYILDPSFNDPGGWNTNGGGTLITGGLAISQDDSGVAPLEAELRAPLTLGQQYQLTASVDSFLSSPFRISVFAGGAEQIIGTYSDSGQTVSEYFTADAAYTHVRIRWFEINIILSEMQITKVLE